MASFHGTRAKRSGRMMRTPLKVLTGSPYPAARSRRICSRVGCSSTGAAARALGALLEVPDQDAAYVAAEGSPVLLGRAPYLCGEIRPYVGLDSDPWVSRISVGTHCAQLYALRTTLSQRSAERRPHGGTSMALSEPLVPRSSSPAWDPDEGAALSDALFAVPCLGESRSAPHPHQNPRGRNKL